MTTKHTIITVSLALVAFVFGCVTEALVVPPVRAGTNPTRWEYKCIHKSADEIETAANKLGTEGWEIAAVGGTETRSWCFKRALP
jgi:hypothetical protein